MLVRDFSCGEKYRKKLLGTIIPLGKCIQLRVYTPYVQNVWISSLTLFLYFDEVTKILFLVLKIF